MRIGVGTLIDQEYRPLLNGGRYDSVRQTSIAPDVYIGNYCVIGRGVSIGPGAIIDDFVKIECDVTIGAKSLICYRATLCSESTIGTNCVIGGFVGERSVIGSGCRVFGSLVHRFRDCHLPWDDDASMEDGPKLEDGVVIGFHSCVVGSIVIGENAYIGAGVTVRKSIAAQTRLRSGEYD